ncbi:MAG: beta-galactosidase [Planctomycetota bacterium]|nr:beta-galactosidase [Planctomycetota bacterium]
MSEEILFPYGCQYYRPPNPPRDQWDRDMARMRQLGFNVIKVWGMWNWINVEPGRFDFEELDEIFDLAEKSGLKVVLNTICENVPWWMAQKFPEAMYRRADGDTVEPMCWDNTPGGGWPGLCFDHPQVRDLAIEYLTQLAGRYRTHPATYGYDCWNEPHIEPIALQTPVIERNLYCYCENSCRNFLLWLRRRYQGIDRLNEAYHTKYPAFRYVRAPRKLGPVPLWMDWQRFWQDNLADIMRWRCEAIRSADPDHFVMSHEGLDGVVTTSYSKYCVGDWLLAAVPDKWGCSWFPNWSETDICEASLHIDIAKSAGGQKECWICELQPGGEPTGEIFTGSHPTPDDMALWNLSALATGMKGVLYWQYRPELLGGEMGSLGMTNNDGSETPRTEIASRLAKLLNSDEFYTQAQPARPKIAILHSKDVHNFIFAAKQSNSPVVESVVGLYHILWKANLPVRFLHVDLTAPQQLNDFPVAFFPSPVCMNQVQAEMLQAYVKQGGILVCEPYLGQFDLHGYVSQKTPGFALDEVFGCVRDNYWRQEEVSAIGLDDLAIQSSDFLESYSLLEGGSALARHADASPAVVECRCGAGRAVMIGTFAFHNEANRDAILHLAGLEAEKKVPYGIYMRELSTPRQRAVVLFNWTKDRTIAVNLKDFGKSPSPDWRQGSVGISAGDITLGARASAILRL